MKTATKRPQTLREIELEVEGEGREWTRQRLQQRLPAKAQQHGEVSPPKRPAVGASAQPRDATAHRRGGDTT